MVKPKFKDLLQKEMTRKDFLGLSALAFISLFGVAGVISELLSHAATPYASDEAENGTLKNGAAKVANNSASGGEAVQFGTQTAPTGNGKLLLGCFVQSGIAGVESLLTAAGLNPNQSGCQQFSYASGNLFASNNGTIQAIGTFPGPIKMFAEAMYWNGNGYDPDAQLPFSLPSDTNYAAAKTYYTNSANACITANVTNVRLGWEFNGAFAGAAKASPTVADFVRTWQFVYTQYNNAAIAAGKLSGYFSFMFCPDTTGGNESFGSAPNGYTITDYYPGKAYMGNPGWISTDFYPSQYATTWDSWLNFGTSTNGGWGFQTMLDLAVANGHGLGLGEWGSQGIDVPTCMTDMLSWTVETALPALKGQNCLYMFWGEAWNGITGMPWDLQAEPNQWAAVKSAFVTYTTQGIISS